MANILIVDDSKTIRDTLRSVITRNGHNVSEAGSVEEALLSMKEDIFDIAIVDLKMGDLGGLDLSRTARSISPDTEIIILTGYATIDTAVEAMKLGVYDFVTKPVHVSELMLIIDRALEKMELADSVRALRTQMKERYRFPDIVGNTPVMLDVFTRMEKICQFDSAVLVVGESGTGKELVARAIHANSPRANKPFRPVNCAALPEDIQESELFGHMQGAFTDAVSSEKGLLEEADGGTVFLDEIAESAPSTQAKLLRFLEDGEIRRVGGNIPLHVDVRIIAATNRDLMQEVAKGTFREDLYYRINVIEIKLPPLREHKDDIPLLVYHFIKKHAHNKRENVHHISREALSLLMEYDWPGNVRELENAIQHAIALTHEDTILPVVLPARIQSYTGNVPSHTKSDQMSLYELQKAYILRVLEDCSWDKKKAAKALGIGRATIYRKLKEYGFINPPKSS